jgi:ketosteroid isomerase-like protein
MSEENVEIVRLAYAAFNRGDLEGLDEVISADCVMDWSQSQGPQKGVYHGPDGAARWIAAVQEAFEEFELAPSEYIGSGDCIVVPTRVTGRGRGSGVAVEASGTTLWEIRNGRVDRFVLYQSREEALEAAGLSE